MIDSIFKELDNLKEDSIKYWMMDLSKDADMRHEAKLLEVKIKATILGVSGSINHFGTKYSPKGPLKTLVDGISGACSGGDFESAKRKAMPEMIHGICNSINQLKSQLLQYKL
jgi:hypothetical protein